MTIAPPGPKAGNALIIDTAQLIGGDWVPAAGGESIDVINPADGEVLARVPRGTADDVDAAVHAAEAAFPAWRDTNATARAALLFRWAALIDESLEELDAGESREVGRPHWGPPPMSGQRRFTAGQGDKVQGLSLPTSAPPALGLPLRE